jgi:radical SAM superfamily enzyme with C-terminal helix-hairpin-helix motif
MKDVKRKMLRRVIPMGRRWRREVVMEVEEGELEESEEGIEEEEEGLEL